MRHGFREAFESGAIDIAAPDSRRPAGCSETRRIADYADTHYISMAPHCIAQPIGTIAAVHVGRGDPELPRARVARDERAVLGRPGASASTGR
jgi:gluconate/galactonate dehydratase